MAETGAILGFTANQVNVRGSLTSMQRNVVGFGMIPTHRRHSRKTKFCKLLKKGKIWRMSL